MAQCSNCQFQNMPGVTHCGRCGASLMLASAKINVHPPRATKWAKSLRKTTFWRFWNSLRRPASELAQRFEINSPLRFTSFTQAIRLIVPGWPQLATAKLTPGGMLLTTYLLFGLLSAACYGSTIGSLFIATAITIHAISLYDVAHTSTKGRLPRLFRSLLACGMIGVFLYLPLFNWVPQIAAPFFVHLDRPPLLSGDVLLVNLRAYRQATPKVGDVVLYDLNPVQLAGMTVDGRNAIINLQGPRFDRILAIPGQSIIWNGNSLTVDGLPSPVLPLNPANCPQSLQCTVPTGHYFILPSTDRIDRVGSDADGRMKTLSIVPDLHIRGRVYWRNLPWSRMGPIR
jgi:hypothetical protein